MACRVAVLLGGLWLLFAVGLSWGQTEGMTGTITGTAAYRQRMALPPDATLVLRLEDVSRMDAPATNLAVESINTDGRQVPIPFGLKYDPSLIVPSHRYNIRATIASHGEMLFTTTSSNPVITQGAPSKVDLMLDQVTSASAAPAANFSPSNVTLDGTYWKLTELAGKPPLKGIGNTEAHLILHANERSIAGSSGCNRIVGTYEMDGDSLHFQPAGMTMMACLPALMKQEQAFSHALQATRTYRIAGTQLEFLSGSKVEARFQARFLK
jgi:putative lipoprotein